MKAIIAAAILLVYANAAYSSEVVLPPDNYDHPFDGRLIVEQVPYFQVMADCGKVEYYHGGRVEACSRRFRDPMKVYGFACHIIYPRLADIDVDTMVKLIRHETAHCNGWAGDHPNGHF